MLAKPLDVDRIRVDVLEVVVQIEIRVSRPSAAGVSELDVRPRQHFRWGVIRTGLGVFSECSQQSTLQSLGGSAGLDDLDVFDPSEPRSVDRVVVSGEESRGGVAQVLELDLQVGGDRIAAEDLFPVDGGLGWLARHAAQDVPAGIESE